MTFRSRPSLDGTYRTVTLLVSGVVAVSLVGAVRAGAAVGIGALALVVGVLAIAWAMAPREVVVEHDELRIERRAWRSQRIPLSEVEGAERLSTIGRAVRVFGVGGFFATLDVTVLCLADAGPVDGGTPAAENGDIPGVGRWCNGPEVCTPFNGGWQCCVTGPPISVCVAP